MHVTRMFPRRKDEILPGGSLYWIIKGKMCVRQQIEDLIEVEREDGGTSCGIVLRPGLIRLVERRHRPFQGWRYLEPDDARPIFPSVQMKTKPCRWKWQKSCVISACFSCRV